MCVCVCVRERERFILIRLSNVQRTQLRHAVNPVRDATIAQRAVLMLRAVAFWEVAGNWSSLELPSLGDETSVYVHLYATEWRRTSPWIFRNCASSKRCYRSNYPLPSVISQKNKILRPHVSVWLVLISVRGRVNPRAIVRIMSMKNPNDHRESNPRPSGL